jgi:integrase
MRLKTMENSMRVYMNPYDYQTMIDCAESRRAEMVMRCMGESGFRVGELTDDTFTMANIRESTHPDVDIHFMPVYGKDTKDRDTDGKYRDAWIPQSLLERLEKYQENEGFDDDRKIFMKGKRTLQRDVEDTRENAAVMEEDENYLHISAHDFRAYFATNMALREGVDIEIVMTLGGWEDRESMDPYLDANFDDIIQKELAIAGVLEKEVDVQPTPYDKLRAEIQVLREAIESLDVDVKVVDSDDQQHGLTDF